MLGGVLAVGLLDPYLVQPRPEEGGTDLTPLIGLLAVAAGLYLLGSLYPAWARTRRTAYAITDRRILVREGERILSLEPGSLGRVEVRERRDASGDLLFHGAQVVLSSIPDVRLAAEQVKELVEAPPPEGAPPEVARQGCPFFYAVEPRKTAGDRFYKVYVAGGTAADRGRMGKGGAGDRRAPLPVGGWRPRLRQSAVRRLRQVCPARGEQTGRGKSLWSTRRGGQRAGVGARLVRAQLLCQLADAEPFGTGRGANPRAAQLQLARPLELCPHCTPHGQRSSVPSRLCRLSVCSGEARGISFVCIS